MKPRLSPCIIKFHESTCFLVYHQERSPAFPVHMTGPPGKDCGAMADGSTERTSRRRFEYANRNRE